MGNIKKIEKEYIVEFFARGLKYQQKAGADKQKALELLQSIEAKIAEGQMSMIVRDIEYNIFFHDFLEAVTKDCPLKTVKRFQKVVNDFQKFLESDFPELVRLSQLTPRIMEQYRSGLAGPKITPADLKEINLRLFLLRHVFEYAIKFGYLNDNPFLHIRFVKDLTMQKPEILNSQEISMILKNLPLVASRMAEFILLTGLDIDEVCCLQWKDVDLANKKIEITHSKGTMPDLMNRTVPLQQRAFELVQKLKNKNTKESEFVFMGDQREESKPSQLLKELRSAGKAFRDKKLLSFLDFRHTFAFELTKKGATLFSLQKNLGHKDIAETFMYAPFIFENVLSEAYRIG